MNRADDIEKYYDLLNLLENRLGGKRKLSDCDGRMDWPKRGVYIFFDSSGVRQDCRARELQTHTAWLGSFSDRERVQRSRLWNNNHVEESYDAAFLKLFERLIQA